MVIVAVVPELAGALPVWVYYPLTAAGAVSAGRSVTGAITFRPPPGMLKTIVCLPVVFTKSMAARSDPAPESLVFVTVAIVGRGTASAGAAVAPVLSATLRSREPAVRLS